jgi:hypothetical protein
MSNSDAHVAPKAAMASTLRRITEVLAAEVTNPTAEPPIWDEFEWGIARAVASMQGISPLLFVGLRWLAPAHWREFLEQQFRAVAGRQRRIDALLQEIDARAAHSGISMVGLKGIALQKLEVYRLGERPMADIDLLVRDYEQSAAARVLEQCGYQLSFSSPRHQLFEPLIKTEAHEFGEHIDNSVKIELHTTIREPLPFTKVDITALLTPRRDSHGLGGYSSPAALMLHLLLHAAGNMRAHALRQIQLHDIAKLAARFRDSDWSDLMAARPADLDLWWAAPPLAITSHYYPNSVPEIVLKHLWKESPWLLRRVARGQRLATVSWCNPRIYAFPGIEWARSAREAWKFMLSRIRPSPDMQRELHWFEANSPATDRVSWYGLSQLARIARWLLWRPPRIQTMRAVRGALSYNSRR